MSPLNKNYIGIAWAGLAIILFWVFILPAWNRTSLIVDGIAERESILSSREEILRRISDLNSQYQERTADVGRISSVVPNTKSAAEMVSTMEAITQQTGMQLIEITMGGSDDRQKELQTVFVELGLIGNYPSFVAFLDLAEKNLRLMDVREISVSQASVIGAQISLNFRVKANAYYLNIK